MTRSLCIVGPAEAIGLAVDEANCASSEVTSGSWSKEMGSSNA